MPHAQRFRHHATPHILDTQAAVFAMIVILIAISAVAFVSLMGRL